MNAGAAAAALEAGAWSGGRRHHLLPHVSRDLLPVAHRAADGGRRRVAAARRRAIARPLARRASALLGRE